MFFVIVARAQDEQEFENIIKLHSWGSGRATSVDLNDEHCGFLPEGCHANIIGNWQKLGFGHGKFKAELDTAWQNSTPNGKHGYCAPITGTAVLEPKGKDGKVFVSISGTACDMLFSSETLPHNYVCAFTVTGGTGEYENVTGSGDLKAIDYGKNKVLFAIRGEIKTP